MPRKGVKMSEAAKAKQAAAITKWKIENTENLSICLRKGKRQAYRQLAEKKGTSVSALVQNYLDKQCRKEGIELPEKPAGK